jgi:hypothetical protein
MSSVALHPDHADLVSLFSQHGEEIHTHIGRHQKKALHSVHWDFQVRANDQVPPINIIWIKRTSDPRQYLERVMGMDPLPMVLLSRVHSEFVALQVDLSEKSISTIPVPEDDSSVISMICKLVAHKPRYSQPDIPLQVNERLVNSVKLTAQGLGTAKSSKILERFGSLSNIAGATEADIASVVGSTCGSKLKRFFSEPLKADKKSKRRK